MRSFALVVCLACVAGEIGCTASAPEGADVRVDAILVRLTADGADWSARCTVTATPARPIDIAAGHEVHVPLGAEVRLSLESRVYICTFSLPELHQRDFAGPDLPNEIRFRADRAGSFELRGDEMCGDPDREHARGKFIVEDAAAFRAWVVGRDRAADR